MKRRVAIYVRVSGEEQVKGYSIGEQKDRLKTYCKLKDWIVVKTYEDPAFSGGTMDRPGLQSMLSACRKGTVDTVLVWKLDRLSRSQKDTLYLIEDVFKPLNIAFVAETQNLDTATPLGMAMIGIMAAFAQLLHHRNLIFGIGIFVDGNLIINEYEALQIRKIFDLFLQGKSLRSICSYMKERYANTHVGYTDPHMISKIIRNPIYIGKIQYKDNVYDGLHEPIIDEETFQKAQVMYKELADKNDHRYRSPFQGRYMLSGLCFCGNCGARYFTHGGVHYERMPDGRYKKTKTGYYYYKCYSRDGNSHMSRMKGCKNPNYRVEELDSIILGEIESLKFEEGYLEQIISEGHEEKPNPIPSMQKELSSTERKISRLLTLYASDVEIDLEDLSEQIKPLYDQRDRLRREIERYQSEKHPDGYLTKEEVRKRLKDLSLEDASLEQKRMLCNDLIEKIVLGREKGDITIYWRF